MNVRVLLLFLFTIVSISAFSQVRKKIYTIKIEDKQGVKLKGWLIALQDSAINVRIPGRDPVDTVISIKSIQRVAVRRKNAPGRGLGYGFLVGAGLGVLIGYATYSPPDCDGSFFCFDFGPGASAFAGGVFGGFTGGLLGLLGGSTSRKYMIYGDQPSYEAFKTKMLNGPDRL